MSDASIRAMGAGIDKPEALMDDNASGPVIDDWNIWAFRVTDHHGTKFTERRSLAHVHCADDGLHGPALPILSSADHKPCAALHGDDPCQRSGARQDGAVVGK